MSKTQAIIQGIYMFLHIFLSIGIVGNIETGVKTPIYMWVMFGITSFLVLGKIIYWILND